MKYLALLIVLSVAACGRDEKAEEPMPVEETVFGDQVEQIDKAKQLSKDVEGRMQDLNSQLDRVEGQSQDKGADAASSDDPQGN